MDIADCPPSIRLTVFTLIPTFSATFSCESLSSCLRSRIRFPNSIKSCDSARLPKMHLLPDSKILFWNFATSCRKVTYQKNSRIPSCFYGLPLFCLYLYLPLFLHLIISCNLTWFCCHFFRYPGYSR